MFVTLIQRSHRIQRAASRVGAVLACVWLLASAQVAPPALAQPECAEDGTPIGSQGRPRRLDADPQETGSLEPIRDSATWTHLLHPSPGRGDTIGA